MIKVLDILKDYKIEKNFLFDLLKKNTWKEYTDKTKLIWDSTFKKIESELKKDYNKNFKNEKYISWKSKQIEKKHTKDFLDKKKNNIKSKNDDNNKSIVTLNDIKSIDFLAETLWINWNDKKIFKKKEVVTYKKNQKEKLFTNTKSNLDKTFFTVKKKEDNSNTNTNKIKHTIQKNNKSNKWSQFSSFKIQKKWSEIKNDFKTIKEQEQKGQKQLENKSKQLAKSKTSDTLKKKNNIIMQNTINIKEFSEKTWIPVNEIIKVFVLNGMPVGINSSVDFDTITLLADDFWIKVEKENMSSNINSIFEWKLKDIVDIKNELSDNLKERPPIITIMWHVDHGKTKLLDYLRKSDVAGKEAWGITQSIWASQITYKWKKINFIDTPWHELFTSMRARGSKITDIAVIVVAADEWVKQQTIEAINHAKAAWVPIMVAITKIDKPNINIDLVKSQLSEHGIVPEEWWWNIPFVKLSAITWEWIDEFLELISLQAEMLELKYNPKVPAVWVILEVSKDAKIWTIATLLIITWTLYKKDIIVAYDTYGKIKIMKDWTWKVIKEATWWTPVQIMWFEWVPESWRIFEVFSDEKEAQKQVTKIKELIKQNETKNVLSSFLEKIKSQEKVDMNIILKAWDFWWLETLKYAIWKVKLHESIELKVIHEEVWQVKETDISLAEASWAFIFGFDSSIQSVLKKKLEQKKIIFKNFTIIYELLDYIESLAWWMIKKDAEEIKIWEFQMLAMFFKKWNDMIIWWKVISWKVINWANFIIKRWDEELWWGKITSIKIAQENVNEVKEWRECWLRVKTWKRFKEWDILEIYITE